MNTSPMSFIDDPLERPASQFALTLAAARAGDRTALHDLFQQFYPGVEQQVHASLQRDLRLSRPWLSTRFSTGDVVQEVFRSVLLDLRGFSGDNEATFAGYLTAVVRNRLIDIVRFHEADRRDGRRTKVTADNDEVSRHDGPVTDAIASEDREVYEAVLSSFDEAERALLRGRIEQQREFKDLARDLGFTSLSATRRAFYAAQAQLVIRLRQRHRDLG